MVETLDAFGQRPFPLPTRTSRRSELANQCRANLGRYRQSMGALKIAERPPGIPVFNSVNLDRIAEFRQRSLSSTDQMRFVVQRLTAEEIADLIGRARCGSRFAATYSRRQCRPRPK